MSEVAARRGGAGRDVAGSECAAGRVTAARPSSSAARAHVIREKIREWRGLWRDFTGESAYERYVARHAREHPDHPPMSERGFWRARDAWAEDNVSSGCC